MIDRLGKDVRRLTLHRVGLSGASFTISQDANIEAVNGRLHELWHFLVDLVLGYVATGKPCREEQTLYKKKQYADKI